MTKDQLKGVANRFLPEGIPMDPGEQTKTLAKLLNQLHGDITSLGHLYKKIKDYFLAFDAASQWILQMRPEGTDLNHLGNPIMKFVRNTWMPLNEAHFARAIDEETGAYQLPAYKAALSSVKERQVALDIGANIGLFAREMSRDFKRVIAFEPQQHARACLARNVRANNVIIMPFALGESESETVINVSDHVTGGAYIHVAENRKDAVAADRNTRKERINVIPLDSLSLPTIDLIKIDVQGHELDVLKGGLETIRRTHPIILIEVGGETDIISGIDKQAPLELLKSLGYREVQKVGIDVVMSWTAGEIKA